MQIAMLLHKSVVHDSRVRREATALAEAGHAVTVVELDREAGGTLDGVNRVSAAPPAWAPSALPFHAYRAAFLALFVARLIELRPDAIHAHDAAMLLPGLLGARLTGARLVYDSHELATGVPYHTGSWARFVGGVERLAVPRCSAVITVTDGIADRLQRRYRLKRRPAVVRNACALPTGCPSGALRQRLRIGDAPLLLHQGGIAHGRGWGPLIDAMAAIPEGHLVMLGTADAGLADLLTARADRVGVTERLHLEPSVPLATLLAHTAEADVGVALLEDSCENHRLALPNKLFEYLAAGLPVVVSDLPELSAVVRRHRVGWTVDPADPADVARGLRAAIAARRDPALLARVRAAAHEFAWQVQRQPLLDVYAAMADRR